MKVAKSKGIEKTLIEKWKKDHTKHYDLRKKYGGELGLLSLIEADLRKVIDELKKTTHQDRFDFPAMTYDPATLSAVEQKIFGDEK